VREVFAFFLLACACGAASWSGRAADGQPTSRPLEDDDGSLSASAPAPRLPPAPPDPGFAALEARAAELAPGMRQAAEKRSHGERVELVQAASRDACVRVAFEADAPVHARLVAGDGSLLFEASAAATAGVLGDRGPVCIRKGDAVSAAAEGDGANRWIAWASP
jgi:hypothetical protein